MKTERLSGSNVSLVPFTVEDVSDTYVAWLNDPQVNRFLEVRHVPQTRETVLAFVQSFYGEVEKYMWGIEAHVAKQLIGTCTLYDINRRHGRAEFGLMVGETAYWGGTWSKEVIILLAGFAFGRLGLRRLTGGSYATNIAMNFTFKRLGFTLEGRLREHCCVGPGEYVDGYRWGLLAGDGGRW